MSHNFFTFSGFCGCGILDFQWYHVDQLVKSLKMNCYLDFPVFSGSRTKILDFSPSNLEDRICRYPIIVLSTPVPETIIVYVVSIQYR